jgi:hypothetical protein
MKLDQHHTSAAPRRSLACFNMRIETECWFGKGWREPETLWRILLRHGCLCSVRESL